MKARIISMVIGAMLIGTSPVYASFTDVKGHWGESTINSWANRNLISGYGDGSFRPDLTVSKVEMVSLINKAFKLSKEDATSFSDVPDGVWFHSAVGIAKAYGYLDGFPDGTFRPNQTVTRKELAEMIQKLLKLPNPTVKDGAKSIEQGAMGAAIQAKIITGYPDGQYRPNAAVTRIEAMVLLDNAARYAQFNTLNSGLVNTSGTFGPVAGLVDIQSNSFTVSAKSVTLRNLYFNGDIIVTNDVDNDLTFDNVIVRGKILVQGSKSSYMHINNSVVNSIEVSGTDGIVDIKSKGTTSIKSTLISSSTILESDSQDTKTAFDYVNVTTKFPKLSVVYANANIRDLEISTESTIQSTAGSIDNILVPSSVQNVRLNIGESAKIKSMMLFSDVIVTGKGRANSVIATTSGTQFETQPTKIQSTIPPVSTVYLIAKINEALTLYNPSIEGTANGNYAVGSKIILKAEIDSAQALIATKTATQSNIDSKIISLNNAITAFTATRVSIINTTVLQSKIQEATNKLTSAAEGTGFGNYSIGSKAQLQSAVDIANGKLNNGSKIQSDYDTALTILTSAVDLFNKSQVGAGDATILNAKLTESNTIYTASTEGVGPSEYPVGAKATLLTAINAAKVIQTAATSKSQLQINNAVVDLQSALDTFRASKNTISDSDVVLAESAIYNKLVTLTSYDVLTDVTSQAVSVIPGKTPNDSVTAAIMSVQSVDGTAAKYLNLSGGIMSIAQDNITGSVVSEQVIIKLSKGLASLSIPITVMIPVYVAH